MTRRLIAEALAAFLVPVALALGLLGSMAGLGAGAPAIVSGLAVGFLMLFFALRLRDIAPAFGQVAFTFALAASGRRPWQEVVPVIVAQTFGAFLGGFLVVASGAGPMLTGPAGDAPLQGAALILAAIFLPAALSAVMLVSTHRRVAPVAAPLAIGLVTGLMVALSPGALALALDPARALLAHAAGIAPGEPGGWIAVLAPIAGAILAGWLWGRSREEDFLVKRAAK